uniref:Uncharacterized protein n=1 Tax=Avena sativa TaxID=4498 RepID=A0ACD5UF75_AVESA
MAGKEAAVAGGERKRKAAEVAAAAAGPAPTRKRKMTRLPQEEIDSILAKVMDDDRLPPEFRALKRHSPDLIPWPEEEMDEEVVSFYDLVHELYAVGEKFREFQAWVRSEYANKAYVEVDDEFLARRAEDRASVEEARMAVLKAFDFPNLMMDD